MVLSSSLTKEYKKMKSSSNKNIIAYETYVAFLEYVKIPMIIIDEDMIILLCNRAFEILSGYNRNEVETLMNWNGLIADPEDLDIMQDYHYKRRIDPASAPEEYEFAFKTKDGVLKDIALTITMIPGTKRSIAFLQDTTEKKKSELWYRTVFENTGLPSIIIDEYTNIVKANAEWFLHSGYSQRDIDHGMSWKIYVHEDDIHRILMYHDKRRIDPESVPRRYEVRIRRKDREVRNTIATVGMIPGSVYSIASLMDVTDLKESEKERDMLEEQLQQSRKLESIGQLAGGIAHDFNNMLAAIMGYSQLAQIRLRSFMDFFPKEKNNVMLSLDGCSRDSLIKRETTEDIISAVSEAAALMAYCLGMIESQMLNITTAYDMIEDVIKASQRAGGLTRQLLAFARKQTLDVKSLKLNDLVIGFKSMLRITIRENIIIETHLAEDLGYAEADPGQIEQIILNLALNAQDAMPDGGRIVISTENAVLDSVYTSEHQGAVPGKYIKMTISDSGTGMDRDTQERIFEPFFTTKEQGKGTGLGLATVYGIVKQHRGNIWVYSEPGKGTSFNIYLPRKGFKTEIEDDFIHFPYISGTETILVVEDQQQVRKMTALVLREQGYNVLEAENSFRALEAAVLYDGLIDLLVSDVVLPGMNGRELYVELLRSRPNMKSLFISGYPMEIISHHGLLDHGFNLLTKPVPMAELTKKIREILDK